MTTSRPLLPLALSAIRPLAAALAIAAASAATPALADSQTIGGVEWSYTVDGGNATVTGANPAEGNLAIPATLGDAAVTAIGDMAFYGRAALTGVEFPAGLTDIGMEAFERCTGLSEVAFPESVTNIAPGAFYDCTGLESVMFAGGGVAVGEAAFYNCTNLVAVDIPDLAAWCGMDFDSPEANPLYLAKHLYTTGKEVSLDGTLVIPDGVARIGDYVFVGCTGLAGVSIPDGVESIGRCSFSGCTGLAEVELPGSVTAIGDGAFLGCTGMGNVAVPGSVTNIGMGAFYGCTSLADMTIPDSVETLGEEAFEGCTALAFLEVPGGWYGTSMVEDAKVPEGCEVRYRGIDPLSVKTTSLPRALVGAFYNAELSAQGGVSPYTWSAEFAEGAGFPEGLSLWETGRLQGAPEEAATCVFTAVATDAKGVSARRELVLEVAAGAPVEGVFARVAELDALEPGEYVITGRAANGTDHYAMRNELGGTSTPYILRNGEEAVAEEGDECIIDPDASLVWTLEEGTAGWTIHNPDAGYVAYTGSKNAATFADAATSNSSWTVTAGGAEGLFAVANAAKPERILQYNATSKQERFACYTNWSSRAQGLAFWKKGGTVSHGITIDPDIEHGTIATVPAGSAKPGTLVEVVATPDTDGDWALQQVMVTGAISEQTWTYAGDPVTFEMPDEDVFVTALFTEGGTGPEEAFVFAGDQAGLVGQEAGFTVEPKEAGAAFFLADFSVPEGSALTADSLALDYPQVTFTPDAAGTYWFVFELSEGEGFGAWSVEAFSDEPVPGGDAFVFGGDSEGVVGQPAAFTVVPTAEGAEAVLASFECPEGSGLGKDALEIDWPQVGFTPDAEGEYRFVFMYAEGRDEYGVWTVTVAPAPAEELRITNMTLRDGTVTLEYVGTAGSVQGTDDVTGVADSWATVPGAAIDAENRTATLPQGKRFLRLSSEAPEEEEETYLVVDLFGGREADEWPVRVIKGVPQDGWWGAYKSIRIVLRKVPAGTFTMGSPEDELGRNNDETQHQVTISKPFYVGVFEVTQKQWELAMGSNPAAYQGDTRPVENVSYEDIRGLKLGSMWPEDGDVDNHSFLGILRAKTGLAFDLPTEAQWEYACRAGTATALNSGKNLTYKDWCSEMNEVGRYCGNGGTEGGTLGRHMTAGSYAPNAWGLYDMHGNVAEWCLDWYGWQGEEAATDPVGEADGDYRSYRGGSWNGYAQDCRSASRSYAVPSLSHESLGFRLVCPVPEEEEERTGVQLWEGGPFWAETNLGAEKPEDAGLYFWWGDTVGYRREGDAWVASDGSSTDFSFDEDNTPTYGKDKDQLRSAGWTTAAGVLAPEHDAAQVQWGGGWRMPTDQELKDLNNNCDWTWTATNGVNGYLVRGRGDFADASIFVPAAGIGVGTSLYDAGSAGDVWSSVPYAGSSGRYLGFYSGRRLVSHDYRSYGQSVRPVRGFAE